MTGAFAAAMLEPFASGKAFFPGSESVSGASRFMAFHGAGFYLEDIKVVAWYTFPSSLRVLFLNGEARILF